MTELLEKDQIISVVPQDFKNSNKSKILDIQDKKFLLEIFHPADGIEPKKMMEFYSYTQNGMLYFSSSVIEMEGNVLTVAIPRKHRFLQRRAFTRVKFAQNMELKSEKISHKIVSINISAGGLKLKTNDVIDINLEYDLCLNLSQESSLSCTFEPIKIEKDENQSYTLSGRFKNLSNTAKITLIQFCMRKSLEIVNK
jgi:c-di-GMP-binding flagellar brake protein YcgR